MKGIQNREAGRGDIGLAHLACDEGWTFTWKLLIVNSTEGLEFKIKIRMRHLAVEVFA